MTIYAQGDILFIEVDAIPQEAEIVQGQGTRHILQRGESTGHAHTVSVDEAEVYTVGTGEAADLYVRALSSASVVHQQHGVIPLEAGKMYHLIRQVVLNPEVPQHVRD